MLDDRDAAGRPSLREALAAFTLLAILTVVVFWPQLASDRRLYWGDIGLYFYPMDRFLKGELAHGRIPLWNPAILCGTPFVGNPQMSPFYPTTVLLSAFSPAYALSLTCALHVWFCGAGMYVWLRALGLRRSACLFGAIAFMFGGHLVAKEQFPNMLQAAAYLPWILWAARRVAARISVGSALLLGVLIGLQVLAAHEQMTLLTLYLAGAYALFESARLGGLGRLPAVAGCAAAGAAAAAGLSACQVLPILQLLQHAAFKQYSFSVVDRFYLPPNQLLNFVLPVLHGHPIDGDFTARGNFWETCCYAGWASFVLACAGFASAARRSGAAEPRFWLCVFVAGTWMAMGGVGKLYYLAYVGLPGFKHFHDPARCLLWSCCALAVAASYGLDGLIARAGAHRRRVAAALGAAACLACFVDLWHFDTTVYPLAPWPPDTSGASVPRLLVADPAMRDHAGRLIAPDSAEVWQRFSPHTSYRADASGYGRLWYDTMTPNLPMSVDLYDAFGYEPICLDVPEAVIGRAVRSFRPDASDAQVRTAAAASGAYGVRYVVTDRRVPPSWVYPGLAAVTSAPTLQPLRGPRGGRVFLCRDTLYQPRLRLAGRTETVSSQEAAVARILAWQEGADGPDLATVTLLSPGADSVAWPPPAGVGGGDCTLLLETPDLVVAQATTRGPETLVLADTHYPGWTAHVDGRPAPILTADGFVRAVTLPGAGSHTVVFTYRPAAAWVGLYLSLLTLSVLSAYGIRWLLVRIVDSDASHA